MTGNEALSRSLKDIRHLLRRRWPLAFVLLVTCVVASSVVTALQSPQYEASSLIEYRSKDAQGAVLGQLMQSFVDQPERALATQAELLQTRSVLVAALKKADSRLTPEQFGEAVEVEMTARTNLLLVTVARPNPQEAAELSNALASAFIDASRRAAAEDLGKARREVGYTLRSTREDILRLSQVLSKEKSSARKNQIKTQLALTNEIFGTLSEKHEQLRILEQMSTGSLRLAERAFVPTVPVSPDPLKNLLLSVFAGVFLAIATTLLAERLDSRIKGQEELGRVLKLPALAEIPRIPDFNMANRSSVADEAFRTLRTNIQFCDPDREIKTILVTSATPSEGKTHISANLAVILAAAGHRVIVVDCDLRRSNLHDIFGVPNLQGVSTALALGVEPPAVVQETGIDNLRVMTSGVAPPNPSELLGSIRMANLIGWLRSQADYVVIDSSPVGIVTDSAVLAPMVDGILYVVSEGRTNRQAARRAVASLEHVGAPLLGAVLNNTQALLSDYYSYQAKHMVAGKEKKPEKATV